MIEQLAMAALQGGGNLVNSLINQRQNAINNAANKQLTEYAYNKNVEMWNAANEYNKPENQMARLKAAGLNPNMVYGNSSVVGNTSTETPKYQAPKFDAYKQFDIGIAPMIQSYMSAKLNAATVDNLKAQQDNTIAKTATEALTQASIAANTAKTQFETNQARALAKYSLQAAQQNVKNMITDQKLKQADINMRAGQATSLQQNIQMSRILLDQAKLGIDKAPFWAKMIYQWTKGGMPKSDNW